MSKSNWVNQNFTEQTPDRRQSGFTLQAICLVTNETHCTKCKSSYRHPQGTMLKLKGREGEIIYVSPKVSAFELDLPREAQTIPYHVDACEQCFIIKPPEPASTTSTPKTEYVLVGTPVGKKELLELRVKVAEEAAQRSNLLPAKKKEKEKAKPVTPNVLELF